TRFPLKNRPSRRTFPERRLRPELDRVRTSLMRLPCGFFATPQREPGGRGRIRTFVARKERQIYSLLVLATHPPVPQTFRTRTTGFRTFSAMTSRRSTQKHKQDSCQETPALSLSPPDFVPPRSPRKIPLELAEGIEPPTL